MYSIVVMVMHHIADSDPIDVWSHSIPTQALPGTEATNLIGGFAEVLIQLEPRPHLTPYESCYAV